MNASKVCLNFPNKWPNLPKWGAINLLATHLTSEVSWLSRVFCLVHHCVLDLRRTTRLHWKRNLSENHKSLDILEEPVLTLTRKVWKKSKLGHKYLNVTYFSTLFRRDSDVTAPQIPSVREGLCTQGFLTEEETSLVSPDRPAEEDRVTGHWTVSDETRDCILCPNDQV